MSLDPGCGSTGLRMTDEDEDAVFGSSGHTNDLAEQRRLSAHHGADASWITSPIRARAAPAHPVAS